MILEPITVPAGPACASSPAEPVTPLATPAMPSLATPPVSMPCTSPAPSQPVPHGSNPLPTVETQMAALSHPAGALPVVPSPRSLRRAQSAISDPGQLPSSQEGIVWKLSHERSAAVPHLKRHRVLEEVRLLSLIVAFLEHPSTLRCERGRGWGHVTCLCDI